MPTPSKGRNWNLTAWLDRLGFKTGDVPQIVTAVQPTMLMVDASEITTPLLPPLGFAGGTVTSGVTRHGAFLYRTLAPGGCFLPFFRSSTPAGHGWQFSISPTPHATLGGERILPITDMGVGTVRGIARIGDVDASELSIDVPNLRVGQASLDEKLYLRPGHEVLVLSETANLTEHFAIVIKDVPATIPEP